MPDLNNSINYTAAQKTLINDKLNDVNFIYQDWNSSELLELRCAIRDFYRNQQGARCCFCKNDISITSASNAHVEHIVPKSIMLTFIFEPKNLCAICADCNQIKNNKEVLNAAINTLSNQNAIRYPRSSNAFSIYHPHFDNYDEHIFKIGDLYFDLSQKGAYTMYVCELNRRAHEYGIEPTALTQEQLREIMVLYLAETNFTRQTILFNRLQEYFIRIG